MIERNRKLKLLGDSLDVAIIEDALKSGNYNTKTIWTELYLRFRQDNIYLYVKKEIPDADIIQTIETIKNLDYVLFNFNIKKAVGAYLLSLICVKPTNNFFVENPNSKIIYKKV